MLPIYRAGRWLMLHLQSRGQSNPSCPVVHVDVIPCSSCRASSLPFSTKKVHISSPSLALPFSFLLPSTNQSFSRKTLAATPFSVQYILPLHSAIHPQLHINLPVGRPSTHRLRWSSFGIATIHHPNHHFRGTYNAYSTALIEAASATTLAVSPLASFFVGAPLTCSQRKVSASRSSQPL